MIGGRAHVGTADGRTEVRGIADGDAIPVDVLRDLLLTCLRHDALRDVVTERLDLLAKEGRLDVSIAAEALPEMIGDVFGVIDREDWRHVSGALTDAYLDASREEVPR
jgi:hypothetical protein